MNCRYDRESKQYMLADGDPCRVDEYGDPTNHCKARVNCAQHIGQDEQTCIRCLNRARTNIRQIVLLSTLMMPVALGKGVNSEAANLAGPAADVDAWSWRKVAAKQGRAWHVSLVEEDDEHHPYTVLTRWQLMLSEDYGHPLPQAMSIMGAGAYLERNLGMVAQDPEQDFALLARELKTCRAHLEAVLGDAERAEKGQPCPSCRDEDKLVRLRREWGHWCEAEDCEKLHYLDDSGDRWVCPRNHQHWWTEQDYRRYVDDVYDDGKAS